MIINIFSIKDIERYSHNKILINNAINSHLKHCQINELTRMLIHLTFTCKNLIVYCDENILNTLKSSRNKRCVSFENLSKINPKLGSI